MKKVSVVISCVTGAAILTWFALVPAAEAPRVDGFRFPSPGSTWVTLVKRSGSFGSGTSQVTIRSLGEQSWQGRKAIAFSDGVTTTYVDAQGCVLARVRGDKPIETWDPCSKGLDWPLFVGKSWIARHDYRNYDRGQTIRDVVWRWEVQAHEDVTTPAGVFKAFKIVQRNPYDEARNWWSPELSMSVKYRFEHFSGSATGPGVLDRELLSYDFR